MLIAQLSSFPIEQVANLLRLEQDLGRWCTDHPYPCRLIAISHAFDIEEAAERVRARLRDLLAVGLLADALLPSLRALTIGDATAPHPADVVADLPARADAALADLCATALPIILDDPEQASATHWLALGEVLEALTWTRPVLADLHDFYTQLATRRIRAATYLLVVWEPPTASAQEILDSLAYATGQRVVRCDQLRPILPGPVMVDEQRACLVPVDRAHPHVAVLRSYDMPTTIDALVLHPLLNGDRDIAIAVDILPLSPGKAQRLAETQYSAASMALRTSRTVDPQTAQRALDAERTLAELTTSSLHQVQVAVLVQGSDADDLAIQVAAARDRLGMAVRVEAVAGSQAELLSLFSTTPSAQIDAAWCRSDMLAHGVGCLLGVVGFHRSPITEGWLFGVDHRQAPVFIDPFSGGRAGHMVYIGVTGFGKTFAMNLLTLRAAALANNRVIWVDAYENGARLERAIGAGATRHVLSAGRTINPLDLVFGPEDGERWLHAQVGHVIAQLALIMGTLGSEGERRVLIPRIFTRDEEGFLQRAVALLYADVSPDAPLRTMPILSDLIAVLEQIDAEEGARTADDGGDDDDARTAPREARALARTLRTMIYGSRLPHPRTRTAFGHAFDGITTVDWSFDNDVTCIDLSIPQATNDPNLSLYYAQAIGAIYRAMRHPRRDRARKTLLVIDEFGLAARIPTVSQMAVTIAKVGRKYGMALVTADQLPNIYLDTADGQQILGNARVKVLFHLEEPEARRIAAAIPEMTEVHVQAITRPDVGRCVIVYDHLVVPVAVEPTDREALMLQGS